MHAFSGSFLILHWLLSSFPDLGYVGKAVVSEDGEQRDESIVVQVTSFLQHKRSARLLMLAIRLLTQMLRVQAAFASQQCCKVIQSALFTRLKQGGSDVRGQMDSHRE